MSYNIEELLKLPVIERYDIALVLWESIENEDLPVTKDQIAIAEERYNDYLKNPNEGMTWGDVRAQIKKEFGI